MKMLIKILIIILFVSKILFGIEIGGKIESLYSAGMENGKEYRRNLKLDLNLNQTFDETEFVGKIRFEEDTIRLREAERVYIREAYLSQDIFFNKYIESINFKLGKIIYTWGNADELKPVDIINPQDLTYLLFKPLMERKYAVFSADFNLFITSKLFYEFVAIPEFRKSEFDNSKIFVLKELKSIPNYEEKIPDASVHNLNYASRIGAEIFNIDTHLIYYNGYDHIPVFSVQITNLNPLGIKATSIYKRIEMLGFDFQKALFSGITIRGEIAYFYKGKFYNLKNSFDLKEKKNLEYTFGFDVVDLFIPNLYGNFQVNGRYIFDYKNEIEEKENENSILGTLEYTFLRDKLKIKLRGFYNIDDNAYALGEEFGIKVSQNYEISFGSWIFEGDKETYYGQFRDNDFAYISANIIF